MGRYDFTINQGSTWQLPMTIRRIEDQSPIDLTNYSGRGQIRRHHRAPDVVAAFTVTIDPDQVTNTGKLALSLTAEQTTNIPAGESVKDPSSKYVYDFEIFTAGDAEVRRVLQGIVYINPEVTRP